MILPDSESLKIQLTLKNGTIHELSDTRIDYQTINFDTYELILSLPDTEHLQKEAMVGNRELSITQLVRQINDFKKKKLPTYGAKVELSKKFSIPFTCLLFGLLGAPLGIHSSRSGKSGSFAMCIVVILLYYVGLIFMQNMGRAGEVEPYSSVWIPNIILLTIIVYTSYKMQKDLPFKFTEWLADHAVISYDILKEVFSKLFPLPYRHRIKPIKYNKNRKQLDEAAKDIMKKKMNKLK